MKKLIKKGFTLVELVVVIAVVAVLAAVSVGAYFGITETANQQAAKTHIKELNDMLLYSEILEHSNNETFHETRLDVERQGLYVTKLEEFGNYKYAWNQETDRFVLVDVSKNGPNGEAVVIYPNEQLIAKSSLFIIARNINDLNRYSDFSLYLDDDFDLISNSDLIVSSGLDTGYHKVNSVTYSSNEEESVIFNTNYFKTKLILQNENAIVKHYGYSYEIQLDSHKNAAYYEKGIVGRLIVSQQDKDIVLDRFSEVFYLYGDSSNVTISGGTAHNITNTVLTDCGASHEHTRIVTDIYDVYKFCEECGHPINFSGETTICDSIGFLYIFGENFNTGCNHSPKLTGEITIDNVVYGRETCEHGGCSFTYIPYQTCIHNWIVKDGKYTCEDCGEFDTVPKANVARLDSPGNPTIIDDLDWAALDPTEDTSKYKTPLELDTAFRFDSVDNANNNGVYTDSYNEYKDYFADFVVSFKRVNAQDYIADSEGNKNIAVEPFTVGLWGRYFGLSYAFHTPINILKDQRIPLLTTMVMMMLNGSGTFNYEFIVENVVSFTCGAFSCSPSAAGVILTVELGLWEPTTSSEQIMEGKAPDIKIGTWDHIFDENPSCIHS